MNTKMKSHVHAYPNQLYLFIIESSPLSVKEEYESLFVFSGSHFYRSYSTFDTFLFLGQ